MGLYERYVFPWILERIDGPEIQRLRKECLVGVEGNVLEIGLGTGMMLPHYPATIHSLTAVEPNVGMKRRLNERIAIAPFPVHLHEATGESLPFPDDRFDAVVVALVLCSVSDPARVLQEIRRVLRPGGTYHFLEHVISDNPAYVKWQHRLNGLQRLIGCGCNLNRPTGRYIAEAGFEISTLDRQVAREMPLAPDLFPFIAGIATNRR